MRTDATIIGHLNELIRALDRRYPQPHRAGEAAIARDSAALWSRALLRIAEIEREAAPQGQSQGALFAHCAPENPSAPNRFQGDPE